MNDFEECIICDEPTGRAGKGEDSLYSTWLSSPPSLPGIKAGSEAGPFCPGCFSCLCVVGLILDEI